MPPRPPAQRQIAHTQPPAGPGTEARSSAPTEVIARGEPARSLANEEQQSALECPADPKSVTIGVLLVHPCEPALLR